MDLAAECIASTINAFEGGTRGSPSRSRRTTNSACRWTRTSRWTDFLTSDGEKPERNRDGEFVDTFGSRGELLTTLEPGWACLFAELRPLTPANLARTVAIRGAAHSVPLVVQRSLGHTCYHVGQIVQVARIHAGDTESR